MTLREAALCLELPRRTVRGLARRGTLPCLRSVGRMGTRTIHGVRQPYLITGRLHFRQADLDHFLVQQSARVAQRARGLRATNPALAALMPRTRAFSV